MDYKGTVKSEHLSPGIKTNKLLRITVYFKLLIKISLAEPVAGSGKRTSARLNFDTRTSAQIKFGTSHLLYLHLSTWTRSNIPTKLGAEVTRAKHR